MKRRDFIASTGAALLGLPLATGLFDNTALAACADDQDWVPVPGTNGALFSKVLFQQGPAQGILYRMAPNYAIGPHRHPAGEYSYVVSGSFIYGTIEIPAGAYSYRMPGTEDPISRAGPAGCVIFVFTPLPVQRL